MWLTFQIRFYDSGVEEPHINRISVWVPSISNLGNISFRLDIRVDIENGSVTADLTHTRRYADDHVWGEEPMMV